MLDEVHLKAIISDAKQTVKHIQHCRAVERVVIQYCGEHVPALSKVIGHYETDLRDLKSSFRNCLGVSDEQWAWVACFDRLLGR
jgi:hypothetical protein